MSERPRFDYVQLVVYDIHGRGMSRQLSWQCYQEVLEKGIGVYAAVCYFGITGAPNLSDDLGLCNINLLPIPWTLSPSHVGNGRVGHVLCDLVDTEGTKLLTSPRTVAEIQLEALAAKGFTLKSATELEFDIRHTDSCKSYAHDEQWASLEIMDTYQDILLEFMDAVTSTGVKVQTMEPESGPGMFEFTCEVDEGIKGPDSTARFKSVAKSFFKKRGLTATFMTRPDLDRTSSGMHFNHSLWTQDGKNAMYDPAAPNRCSEIGQYWLAGLVKHAPAITALCCPTVNCYRRIGGCWAPDKASWAVDNRATTIRLKSEGSNVYVENRLPSGASNPYVVLAATIAAGLDGINNKLPLPPASSDFVSLPRDLETALHVLESDDVIVQALGKGMIKRFLYCKRTFEIEPWNEVKDAGLEQQFQKERELYFSHA